MFLLVRLVLFFVFVGIVFYVFLIGFLVCLDLAFAAALVLRLFQESGCVLLFGIAFLLF